MYCEPVGRGLGAARFGGAFGCAGATQYVVGAVPVSGLVEVSTEARVTGGSCALASAGSGATDHELGSGITAADISHSASGWTLGGAGAARAGWWCRMVTAVEHPLTCTA